MHVEPDRRQILLQLRSSLLCAKQVEPDETLHVHGFGDNEAPEVERDACLVPPKGSDLKVKEVQEGLRWPKFHLEVEPESFISGIYREGYLE